MWLETTFAIIVILPALAVYLQGHKKNPDKIFGIYSQPGKWYYVKYFTALAFLKISKLKSKMSENAPNVEDLEKPQTLSSHPQAYNAVFFQGVDTNGYYLCGGIEHRHEGKAFGLFYVMIPNLGVLGNKELPSTTLKSKTYLQHDNRYLTEDICFTMEEPMKKWSLLFDGQMKLLHNDPKVTFQVKLEAKWVSDNPYFLYKRDSCVKPLARALAREEWTKKFIQNFFLKRHAVRYEQMGNLQGTLLVNDNKYELNMWSYRDHSFGLRRDWSSLHRFIFHVISLENGTRIVLGVQSNLLITSHYEMGYILHNDKSMHAIESCSLQLYQHGEDGTPEKQMNFSFAAGRKIYNVTVEVVNEAIHYKGENNEGKIIERFAKFEVNGIKGRGFVEWHYNVQHLKQKASL